jgi:putative hemolysin
MSEFLFESIVILILIFLNGVFAMSELSIVAGRKTRLEQWANEGNARARSALELAKAPRDFLSTVQIGITLVSIFAGAFGGTTLARQLAGSFSGFPLIAPYSDGIAIGIVVLAITYLSLVLGELVPKHIALNNPERIAVAIAGPMRLLSHIASPAVRILGSSTEAILRLFRLKPTSEPPVTQEEVEMLMNQGARAGVFELTERDMVENVLRLSRRRVGTLMTPRRETIALFLQDSPEDIRRKISKSKHSYFVVCEGTIENVVGAVHVRDLLVHCLAGNPLDLKAAMMEPLNIPEHVPALQVLELFKKSGKRMGFVVDEGGVFQGLVTFNHVLEAAVGEITQWTKPTVVKRADGSWLVDGMLPLDEFKRVFHVRSLPGEKAGAFQTVGGFVMACVQRVPSVGDTFSEGELRYEVVDMDGHRVDKVLVVSLHPALG